MIIWVKFWFYLLVKICSVCAPVLSGGTHKVYDHPHHEGACGLWAGVCRPRPGVQRWHHAEQHSVGAWHIEAASVLLR